MKNPELFNKTISILVKAYQNNTLQHSYCSACAVGNIVAANMNLEPVLCRSVFKDNDGRYVYTRWNDVFFTGYGEQVCDPDEMKGEAKAQIDSTGYKLKDLMRIEFAFETASVGKSEDEWMFNGLMAVCDCLMIIHEANETEITESKSLFIKQDA